MRICLLSLIALQILYIGFSSAVFVNSYKNGELVVVKSSETLLIVQDIRFYISESVIVKDKSTKPLFEAKDVVFDNNFSSNLILKQSANFSVTEVFIYTSRLHLMEFSSCKTMAQFMDIYLLPLKAKRIQTHKPKLL